VIDPLSGPSESRESPGPLRIIRGLGGNGSTFLSRVLASLDNVVLLSETNPLSANLFAFGLNPVRQIESNYPQLDFGPYAGHVAELGVPALFGRYIERLHAHCLARNLALVIRDYNYVDYIGTPFTMSAPGRSSLDVALSDVPLRQILLIRHPAAQFLSLAAHPELKNGLEIRGFLTGYRGILDDYGESGLTRYEDVFARFEDGIRRIADELRLPYAPGMLDRLASTDWMTGNEKGKSTLGPRAMPAPLTDEARAPFRSFADYRAICDACGYEP
jgi:hypothetical protein